MTFRASELKVIFTAPWFAPLVSHIFKEIKIVIAANTGVIHCEIQPLFFRKLFLSTDPSNSHKFSCHINCYKMAGLMFRAFKNRQQDDVKRWLNIADNIDIKDDKDMTALMHSLQVGIDCVSMLLDHGAKPDNQSCSGDTVLHMAVKMGFKEVVELLVNAGANVNIVNDHGNTALHYACFYKYYDITIYLIDSGALIGALNLYNKSPLDFCNQKLKDLIETRAKEQSISLDKQHVKTRQVDLVLAEAKAKHLAQTRQTLQVNSNVVKTSELLWKSEKYDVYYGECNHIACFIKKLSFKIRPSNELLQQLSEEVNTIQKVYHANIMPILAICTDPINLVAIIFETPTQTTLQQLIHDQEVIFDAKEVIKYAADVCSALIHLHSNNLSHLNLKSRCITLSNKTIQIFDYALNSTILAHIGNNDKIFEPEWIAPEILSSGTIKEEPADVYSFGILLYELVTREYPYGERNAMELGLKICLENLRPEVPEFIPKHLKMLMELCWRDLEQRPSLVQVKAVLDQMLLLEAK